MPCQHRLRELTSKDMRLNLNDFHLHWHVVERITLRPEAIMRPEDHLPVVLKQVANNVAKLHQQRVTIQHLHELSQQLPCPIKEPGVVRTKGRPTSTKRNPSGFEYVEPQQKRSKAESAALAGVSATAKHQ